MLVVITVACHLRMIPNIAAVMAPQATLAFVSFAAQIWPFCRVDDPGPTRRSRVPTSY